ncbi:WPP domain-associated protein isoform X2 [Herrania umbratica]|uniref:WPP domain-associated protein isoform X2 n=1 Tax=Herrania umbratica TaxID=108875 RepID=A0A6J1BG42_9ROSI|nr:WPP domain-associated protein isoform X2 [Herrania umbratica]
MAMESCKDVNARVVSCCDASVNGSVHIGDNIKEDEELDVDFLNEFDSYVEDIKDRLTISRLVSDSVIRGMVNAVEQEAADRIAQKELELVRLKKMMNPYHVCSDENKSLLEHYEPNIEKDGVFSRLSDSFCEHDRIRESLGSLKNAAKGQFKNLGIEIDKIRGHSSIRRINSGPEWVGLGGILQEDETRDRIDLDKTLDSLRITLDTIYERVDDIICSSGVALCQRQLEREYQEDVEHMVVTNCIRSLKEQFEERLWDQNAQCYGNGNVNWIEKINEISSLRQELDTISKSLSNPETGMLNSHSSLEINDDLSNNKRTDHLHRKVSENHVSSLWEGNGKQEESVIAVPENLDAAQLSHMSKGELVNFFKLEMTKMKRNHDYKLQQMTEEYFSLKREYLKERGSSLPFRKDKEFDVLRKKIPDVIVKLDRILVGNEKFPLLSNNGETLGILKDRLESLLSENHQLRDSLSDKKKEVNRLSSQVSDAIVKISQYSRTEDNLLKKVENLESAVEDVHIESSISGDVHKCFIREAISQTKRISQDLEMEHIIMEEIYDLKFRDAFCNMPHASKSEFEDSDLESLIMEGLCAIVFRAAFSEAKEKLHDLSKDAFEKERVLKLEVEEKEKLQQHMLLMASAIDEKEKLLNQTSAALAREKEKFMLASQELDVVRDQTNRQQMIISKCNEESNVLKVDLLQALEKLELQQVETCKLNQKLDQAVKALRESDDEKRRLLVAAKEKENILSLVEANENEHRKQMESIIILVEGLSKTFADFECRVAEDTKRSNLRLENLNSQFSSLIQTANVWKRKGLHYKQNLERRCSDLEKAETEVDLLGDQVDVLLGLLEKIYIALDHYSPILKHYTGIMEILKLVRRELSGESTRPV